MQLLLGFLGLWSSGQNLANLHLVLGICLEFLILTLDCLEENAVWSKIDGMYINVSFFSKKTVQKLGMNGKVLMLVTVSFVVNFFRFIRGWRKLEF